MQAIRTRYHGPTNTRGARISAQCEAGRIYVSWDYALGIDGNHEKAAKALCRKLKWTADDGYSRMVMGFYASDGYHVFKVQS